MKAFSQMVMSVIGLTTLLSCESRFTDPTFGSEQRYKHDLFGSEAECRQQFGPNPELNCAEIVWFGADGRVSLLLGGGDTGLSSQYRREGQTITIDAGPGLPKEIEFKVLSDKELVRLDTGTRWYRY